MAKLTKNEKYIVEQYVRYFGKTPTDAQIAEYADLGKPKLILAQIRGEADDAKPSNITYDDYIDSIFQNLFGRPASGPEKTKYAKTYDKKGVLPINAIVKAAKSSDKAVYQTKKAVALLIAEEGSTTDIDLDKITKDTYKEIYNPKTKKLLVDKVAQLETKIDAMPDNVTGQTFTLTTSADTFVGNEKGDVFNAYDVETSFSGAKNTLTGVDSLDGGEGKDTLNVKSDTAIDAVSATIKNIETINLEIANTIGATTAFDTTTFTGVETLNVTKATFADLIAADTTDVNVSGISVVDGDIVVEGGKNIVINDTKAGGNITIGNGVAGGDATGTITITDTNNAKTLISNNDIDVEGGTDVTVVATSKLTTGDITIGSANGMATGNVSVTQNLTTVDAAALDNSAKTITVNGGKTVTVTSNATTTNAATKADSVAGSTIKQAAVTVNADNTTTSVTVNQTANATDLTAVEAKAAVAGTQVVTFTAMTVNQTVTVDGLTFTAAKSLTAAEVAAAFSNISATTHLPTTADYQSAGGTVVNGTYSGQTSANFTTGAATGATVTYTQVVGGTGIVGAPTGTATATVAAGVTGSAATSARTGVAGVETGTVTIADNATKSITTVSIDGYATANLGTNAAATDDLDALTTLSLANGLSTGTATVVTNAATLGLTLNNVQGAVVLTDAALKTLNLTTAVKDSSTALSNATVETLNVTGTNLVSLTNDLAALKTVTVSGTAGLTLAATTADTITSVDASATSGKVTTFIDGDIATYKGGSGVDNLTIDAALTTTNVAKAITLGAGNDILTLGAITIGAGSIDGGAGTDTISMTAIAAVNASGDTTFAGKVTNFEQLILTGANGAQTIDAAKLGNYNYVQVLSAAALSETTITGLTSGATIAIDDGDANVTNDNVIAVITDAATSTSDVLNIAISASGSNTAADDSGIVTAANVETINISVTDTNIQTPTNIVAGAQTLTLQATSAKTITITGDTALNLTNTGNIAATLIDGSKMTGALTVQADGLVASTIKGGSGNDTLTASSTLSIAAVAQVSTITLTDGTNSGLTVDDTMAVTVGGTTFTYTATAATETMDTAGAGLAALINANAAYSASYSSGVITVTAAVVGTPFTVSGYAVTDAAANATGTSAASATTQTAVSQSTAVTLSGTDDDNSAENVTITITDAGGTSTVVATVGANAAASTATIGAVTKSGSTATYTATIAGGVVTINSDTEGLAFTAVAAGGEDITGSASNTTDGTVEIETLTLTDGTANTGLTVGDTMAVTLTAENGAAATFTYTATAATETVDTAATGLAALINANGGYTATASANVITITAADTIGNFTASAYTVTDFDVDNATGTSAALATPAPAAVASGFATTANILEGGAGNDTLIANAGMVKMYGGAGNDIFSITTASINVNSAATIMDLSSGDVIKFANADSFKAAGITLDSTAVFQDYANAAIASITTNNDLAWFQYSGNTYIIQEKNAATDADVFVNGEDFVVKIAGLVDLSTASFNATNNTLEIA